MIDDRSMNDHPCYLDLIDGQVVAYSPDRATHDPLRQMLLIEESVLADDVIVETIFNGRAFVDRNGLVRTIHPHGWCPNPPEPFCTSVKFGDEYEFFECYEEIEDAREGHQDWVENFRERMAEWRAAGFSKFKIKNVWVDPPELGSPVAYAE